MFYLMDYWRREHDHFVFLGNVVPYDIWSCILFKYLSSNDMHEACLQFTA